MSSTSIVTLIENNLSAHKGLQCEFGLSFYINTGSVRILFDCGSSGAIVGNARKLNVDLESVDLVVLSHGHFDHCGGFRSFVDAVGCKRLVTGPGFFEPKYAVEGMRHSYIGVDFGTDFMAANGIRHEICDDVLQLDDGCWLMGNIERTVADETIPLRFSVRRGGKFAPDLFRDEICMALRFEDGLALVVGCSHPGIVNVVQTAQKRFDLPVRGIWGGTHLGQASAERIDRTLAALKSAGVRHFGLSHCSGEAVFEKIAGDPGMNGCRLCTGDGIFM